jgi:glycerophosphoryl diester phosphodiesterase
MATRKTGSLTTHSHHRPLVIAHRGASGLAPENTLAAFELAIALGADGVEMDVQLAADGRVVVIHDTRVNRTTDAAGRVANFTVEQFAELDAGGWFEQRLLRRPRVRALAERAAASAGRAALQFATERVPTLEAVLDLLAPARLRRIYIELKGVHSDKAPLLEAIHTLVCQRQMEREVTLLSFDHAIIKRVKQVAPRIRTAATFGITSSRLVSTRAIIKAAGRVEADEVALHYALVTRRAVAALRRSGFAVSVWTANSRLLMRRLAATGVDGIMTNFPDRLIDLLGSTHG